MSKLRKTVSLMFSPLWQHKWLLLVCLVPTVGYCLISVYEAYWPAVGSCRITLGWPHVYIQSEVPSQDIGPPYWTGVWSMLTHAEYFDRAAFALNLATAAGISLGITYAWAWHRSQATKAWQFGVKQLLLATTVIGLIGGFYAKQRMEHLADQRMFEELRQLGWTTLEQPSNRWFVRPLRHLRIVGDDTWTDVSLTTYDLPGKDVNDLLAQQVANGRRSTYITCIAVSSSNLNDQGVENICRMAPDCRRFLLSRNNKVSTVGLKTLLREAPATNFLLINSGDLNDESFEILGQFQQLEVLSATDTSEQTSPECIEPLKCLPRLHKLGYPKHWKLRPAEQEFDHPVELVD